MIEANFAIIISSFFDATENDDTQRLKAAMSNDNIPVTKTKSTLTIIERKRPS